jgi:glycosyltransferase involved in cell wall biosynthesis
MPQDLKPIRVAAVFATMNRSSTAVACLNALAGQSRPPDLVVIADNASSDTTVSDLSLANDLPFELIVHRLEHNLGNAGGVKAAMELAFSKGANAVWILDDDSWPRRTALSVLIAGTWNPMVCLHSIQIDPKTGKLSWPLQIHDGHEGWRMAWSPADFPQEQEIRSRITWTGALLPREVWEATGPVNGELFIRGEDEEYPLRMELAGFPQFAVVGSILDHPGPENIVIWNFLGKRLFFECGLVDWKLFYKVRNMVWLQRVYHGNAKSIAMAAAYVLASIWYDGIGRSALLFRAIRDGWSGRLGKMPGKTAVDSRR